MTTTMIHQSIATTPFSSLGSPMAWLATLLRPLAARSDQQTRDEKTPVDAAHAVAAVRVLAYRHLPSDPGFAADLFAAADRHLAMAESDTTASPATQRR